MTYRVGPPNEEDYIRLVMDDLRDEDTRYSRALLAHFGEITYNHFHPQRHLGTWVNANKFARDMRDYAKAQIRISLRESKPVPIDYALTRTMTAARFLSTIGNGPNYGKAISGWLKILRKTLEALFKTGCVGRYELEGCGVKIPSPPGIRKLPNLDLKGSFLAATEERDGEITGWVTNGHYAFGPVPPEGNAAYVKTGNTFYLTRPGQDVPEGYGSQLANMGSVVPIADLRDGSWTEKWTEIFPLGVVIERGDDAWEREHGAAARRVFPVSHLTKNLEEALGANLRNVEHVARPQLLFSKTLSTAPHREIPFTPREMSDWVRAQGMEVWGGVFLTYAVEAWAWATQQPRTDTVGTRFFTPNDDPLSPIVVLEAKRVDRAMEKREGFDKGGINSWERVAIVMPVRLTGLIGKKL